MARTSAIAALIFKRLADEERQRREAVERAIKTGPPTGSGITAAAWASWHRYGFFRCPGEKRDLTCENEACRLGSRCAKLAALGLHGDGAPMPRKDRPACGAKTRAGGACVMRVEPGKKRCRLHGGMSTGPRTAGGKAQIVEAQRQRWARLRAGTALVAAGKAQDARSMHSDGRISAAAPATLDDVSFTAALNEIATRRRDGGS